MTSDQILQRLRRFLLALAGILFGGTLLELILTGHNKEPVQFVPFVLCALGLLVVGAALWRPQRKTLLALRASALPIALGSLYGTYAHLANNAEFYLEVHPRAATLELIAGTLGGRNPLVAPGILAVAALLALAATYVHPALQTRADTAINQS